MNLLKYGGHDMFCGNCGSEIIAGNKFCVNCGQGVDTRNDISEMENSQKIVYGQNVHNISNNNFGQEKKPRKKGLKIALIVAVCLAAVVGIGVTLILSLGQKKERDEYIQNTEKYSETTEETEENKEIDPREEKYNEALIKINEKKYEEAYAILEMLEEYKDAQELLSNFEWKVSKIVDTHGNILGEYEYDEYGNCVFEKELLDWTALWLYNTIWENTEEYIYEYDEYGRCISMKNGDIIWEYVYDSNNNLISKTNNHEDCYRYTYDKNNMLLLEEGQTYNEESLTTYVYDDDKNIKKITTYDNYGTYVMHYTYDEQGKCTEEYQCFEGDEYKLIRYTYDDKGRKKDATIRWCIPVGEIDIEESYSYEHKMIYIKPTIATEIPGDVENNENETDNKNEEVSITGYYWDMDWDYVNIYPSGATNTYIYEVSIVRLVSLEGELIFEKDKDEVYCYDSNYGVYLKFSWLADYRILRVEVISSESDLLEEGMMLELKWMSSEIFDWDNY